MRRGENKGVCLLHNIVGQVVTAVGILPTEPDHRKENENGFWNQDTPRVKNSKPIVDCISVLEAFSKSFQKNK